MMHIRPVEMPLLRGEILRTLVDMGPQVYKGAIEREAQYFVPEASNAAAAGGILAGEEIKRVAKAELFYVSAPMLSLAKVAERSLPTFSLMPFDLPSDHGFILFEEPIDVVDYEQSLSPIVGASWGPFDTTGSAAFLHWPHGGIWITWYSDVSVCIQSGLERGTISEATATTMRSRLGRVQVDNESQVPFSPDPIPVFDHTENVELQYGERTTEGTAHWVGILKTVWTLMGQSIASVSTAHYDRAARRQMKRAEVALEAVRVVTLRRPKGGGDGEADREYHHRWIVRGHWRMQPHGPGRSSVRPVWIAPHIKGPEDAPLLGGEKVYALKR